MTYFELFDLPVSLQPDMQTVKRKFYDLSRKYHPDFYANSAAEEQADVLEKSSLINKAYKTFQQPDETIKYVLQLHGLLEEEEKYTLPAAFLGDMLDLNEQMMEAKMDGDAEAVNNLQASVANIQAAIYAPVKTIVETYKEGITTKEELLQVKDYYYKKKYLSRILAGIR